MQRGQKRNSDFWINKTTSLLQNAPFLCCSTLAFSVWFLFVPWWNHWFCRALSLGSPSHWYAPKIISMCSLSIAVCRKRASCASWPWFHQQNRSAPGYWPGKGTWKRMVSWIQRNFIFTLNKLLVLSKHIRRINTNQVALSCGFMQSSLGGWQSLCDMTVWVKRSLVKVGSCSDVGLGLHREFWASCVNWRFHLDARYWPRSHTSTSRSEIEVNLEGEGRRRPELNPSKNMILLWNMKMMHVQRKLARQIIYSDDQCGQAPFTGSTRKSEQTVSGADDESVSGLKSFVKPTRALRFNQWRFVFLRVTVVFGYEAPTEFMTSWQEICFLPLYTHRMELFLCLRARHSRFIDRFRVIASFPCVEMCICCVSTVYVIYARCMKTGVAEPCNESTHWCNAFFIVCWKGNWKCSIFDSSRITVAREW